MMASLKAKMTTLSLAPKLAWNLEKGEAVKGTHPGSSLVGWMSPKRDEWARMMGAQKVTNGCLDGSILVFEGISARD